LPISNNMLTSFKYTERCNLQWGDDNAPMESFWGLLKTELVHVRQYTTHTKAIADIT